MNGSQGDGGLRPSGSPTGAAAGKGSSSAPAVRLRMAPTRADHLPSATLLFLRANWRWLAIVIAAAIVVMLFASD